MVDQMTPDGLTERIIAIIAKTQRLDPAAVTAESTFADLKIDSLDGINIIFALEGEFKISIPDEAARKLASVRDAVDGVRLLLTAQTQVTQSQVTQ